MQAEHPKPIEDREGDSIMYQCENCMETITEHEVWTLGFELGYDLTCVSCAEDMLNEGRVPYCEACKSAVEYEHACTSQIKGDE